MIDEVVFSELAVTGYRHKAGMTLTVRQPRRRLWLHGSWNFDRL